MHKSTGSWGTVVLSIASLLNRARGISSVRRDNFAGPEPDCRRTTAVRRASWVLACLSFISAGNATATEHVPEVNGLFYGDGDDERYVLWDTSFYGSKLYVFVDVPNTQLYVAMVVDRSVNDNVFGASHAGWDGNYMQSAGWGTGGGQQRSAAELTNSEYASFKFACETGSERSWEWQQGYACQEVSGSWVSDESCQASAVLDNAFPPGLDSASSFAQNINTYTAKDPGPYPWDLYVFGTGLADWKSPFEESDPDTVPPNNPNTVIGLDGYPAPTDSNELSLGPPITYSSVHEWEWAMVYEWSIDLGENGTDCGSNGLFLITGISHHSPMKEGVEGDFDDECGEENDCFPPEDRDPLSDFGDLPESYGTLTADTGAQHYITVTGPYLGPDIQTELDGQPSSEADGDGVEEDGVTVDITDDWTSGSTVSIDVDVSNAPDGALLGAWFDWNWDGDFDDEGEFFTWNVSEGSSSLEGITVGGGFDWQTDDLYARFRIFSGPAATPDGNSLTKADYIGVATDGEVEDYYYPANTLPVSLNAFSSTFAGNNLQVQWQTASETNNVGFELWGAAQDGVWRVLGEFIPSRGMDSALPQEYTETVSAGSDIVTLALVDYDTRGRAERFGPFTPGEEYGELQPVERIDWEGPRLHRQRRLEDRGFVNTSSHRAGQSGKRRRTSSKRSDGRAERKGANNVIADFSRRDRFRKLARKNAGNGKGPDQARRSESEVLSVEVASSTQELNGVDRETITLQTGPVTHVAVTEAGIQRVSYEALRDAGLELAGVSHDEIAVTSRGEPVARWIDGSGDLFGPGQSIEFIGRPPEGDDALYVESNLYQVAVDASRVRDAKQLGQGRARNVSESHQRESIVDRPLTYRSQSPTGDPWVETSVVTQSRPKSVTLDIPVVGAVIEGPASLIVGLGTISDLPDITDSGGNVVPEHNVVVELKGHDAGSDYVEVTRASISGQQDWEIEAALPSGFLGDAGVYKLRLTFETDYLFSMAVVDRYGLRYRAPYVGPRIDFAPDPAADGYRVENLGGAAVSAYAEGADGSLTRIAPRIVSSGAEYAAELRQTDAVRFWVDSDPRTPDIFTTEASGDLLAEPADLVVITDSSFVGTAALEDYVRSKAAYNPLVVDVEDIYNSVGFGMALPGAINAYLKARDEISPFSHVQLVGADCYDRLNYISDCISFVPLPTTPVGVAKYSPSQNRVVDLDGDAVGDNPIGQFSVRDESELAMIVEKGSSWQSNVAGSQSALLVADDNDGKNDFLGQIERLGERLDWPATDILDMADHPNVDTASDAFSASLDAGRAITIFSGHSSTSVWSFRSLLSSASAKHLTNAGRPTMMVPLACESTYDISPNANVLGHQLMYAGDRGAVAISGAVSLSGLDDNERMANYIIDGLKSGLTLGEAVQSGRDALGTSYRTLHDNWITQGDVTAKLVP